MHVTNLTPPGAEPHDLELSPDDVATVKSAGTVLLMGHGFQPQLERAARDSNARVITLLDTPASAGSATTRTSGSIRSATPSSFERSRPRCTEIPLRSSPGCTPSIARFEPGLAHCHRRELVTGHEAFGYPRAATGCGR